MRERERIGLHQVWLTFGTADAAGVTDLIDQVTGRGQRWAYDFAGNDSITDTCSRPRSGGTAHDRRDDGSGTPAGSRPYDQYRSPALGSSDSWSQNLVLLVLIR
jgi:hypothetical protein